MKIALCLSGLPRIYPVSAASWGRIIGRYQPDIFVHSWCDDPWSFDYIKDQLNWVFKPTQLCIDPTPSVDSHLYPDRHWPMISVDRSLIMWQGIARAHDMCLHHGDYDCIIRGRMDWHVHNLDLELFDGATIPFDRDKLPLRFTYQSLELHGFNDHFAYGTRRAMDAYVRTGELIHDLYSTEGIDYCPENFLAASLIRQQVPVRLQRMEHCLIRN